MPAKHYLLTERTKARIEQLFERAKGGVAKIGGDAGSYAPPFLAWVECGASVTDDGQFAQSLYEGTVVEYLAGDKDWEALPETIYLVDAARERLLRGNRYLAMGFGEYTADDGQSSTTRTVFVTVRGPAQVLKRGTVSSGNIYNATLQYTDGATWTGGDSVLLWDANDRTLTENERYVGVPIGTKEASGEPIYITWVPAGGSPYQDPNGNYVTDDLTTLPRYSTEEPQVLGQEEGGWNWFGLPNLQPPNPDLDPWGQEGAGPDDGAGDRPPEPVGLPRDKDAGAAVPVPMLTGAPSFVTTPPWPGGPATGGAGTAGPPTIRPRPTIRPGWPPAAWNPYLVGAVLDMPVLANPVLSGTVALGGPIIRPIDRPAPGSAVTLNAGAGDFFFIYLTAATSPTAIDVAGGAAGQVINIVLGTDGMNSVTWASKFKFEGGVDGGAPTSAGWYAVYGFLCLDANTWLNFAGFNELQ